MSKRRNNIHMLDGHQRKALGKFQQDFQKMMPHAMALAETAKKLHQAMIDAPLWRIAEAPQPDNTPEQQPWSVGHAKVNYVDEIKIEGTQDK